MNRPIHQSTVSQRMNHLILIYISINPLKGIGVNWLHFAIRSNLHF